MDIHPPYTSCSKGKADQHPWLRTALKDEDMENGLNFLFLRVSVHPFASSSINHPRTTHIHTFASSCKVRTKSGHIKYSAYVLASEICEFSGGMEGAPLATTTYTWHWASPAGEQLLHQQPFTTHRIVQWTT